MVAVGAESFAVVAFEDHEHRVIHHILEGAAGHREFAHRLLGQHRGNLEFARGPDVPAGGESEPVAAADGGAAVAQTYRCGPGEVAAQCGRIGAGEVADQGGSAVGELEHLAFEPFRNRLRAVGDHQQEPPGFVPPDHDQALAELMDGLRIDGDLVVVQEQEFFHFCLALFQELQSAFSDVFHEIHPYRYFFGKQ